MSRVRSAFAPVAALVLVVSAPVRAAPSPGLASCSEAPDHQAAALCLYGFATPENPLREAAAGRLQQLAAEHPESPWFPIYLAKVKWQVRRPEELKEAERLYRRGAGLAASRGMAEAEFEARWGICRILRDEGYLTEAAAEVERAREVASSSGKRLLQLRADILQALQWQSEGEVEQAYQILHRIERAVETEDSYLLSSQHLSALAKAAQETGRFHETRRAYRRKAERAALAGDRPEEARTRYGLAALTLDELLEVPSDSERTKLLELVRSALTAARSTNRPSMEAEPLWMLGFLEAEGARGKLERCFAVSATPLQKSFCRSALALRTAATDPGMAEAAIQEALAFAQQSRNVQARTAAWTARMRVSWTLGPRDKALSDAWAALDAIEALRDQQDGSAGQPSLFATWAEQYYWLSGSLLKAEDLERAFEIIERMRSRTLIDSLGLSGQGSQVSPALYARRADIFLDIASVQRRLFEPSLGSAERAKARAELDNLESEESSLRAQIAQANPVLRQISFASLEQVRESLAEDEALLSFQVAPWKDLAGDFGGGAWLLVSTRDATTQVYHLPDRAELRQKVTAFIGMIKGRDRSEARGASILYKKLLAPALAKLPAGVRRLVIVPDDYLHRLPFAVLRPEPDGLPLATRYQITLAPSATLWLRWRKARPAPAVTRALVLADPVTLATRREAAADSELAPLPYAENEGKSVKRHLSRSRLVVGEDASETYLKKNVAGPFDLFHFAAHAITDEVKPDSSGIYLSPGDSKEDGLLQVREISELELDSRIVVLSTCESASGRFLRGEGVMGLARAFFQARAHTVVASLWPLRDDYGADLFDRFYHHLGKGKSVAAALQAAQLDRMKEGAPTEAWAGVVVLGDGDRIPVPGGRRPGLVPWTLGLIAILALAYLAFRARQRRMTTA